MHWPDYERLEGVVERGNVCVHTHLYECVNWAPPLFIISKTYKVEVEGLRIYNIETKEDL